MIAATDDKSGSATGLKKYVPKPSYWETFSLEKVLALSDEQLLKEMASIANSHCWMRLIPQERILQVLQGRFEKLMTGSGPASIKERIRLRLGCAILREQLLSSPFYAERDQRLGEQYWIESHQSCYNV